MYWCVKSCRRVIALLIGIVKDFGFDEFRLRLQGGFMRCISVLIGDVRYMNYFEIIDNFEIINEELHALEWFSQRGVY